MSQISNLVALVKADTTDIYQEINFGTIPNFQAQHINAQTGIFVKGAIKILSTNGIRHAFNNHGNDKMEKLRGQIGIIDTDFEFIPQILNSPDSVSKGNISKRGDAAVLFIKIINNRKYHVVMNVLTKKSKIDLLFATIYIKK